MVQIQMEGPFLCDKASIVFLTTKHIAIGKTELGNSQTLINLKF